MKETLQLTVPEYMTIEQYAAMTSYKGQSKFGRLVHTVSILTGQSKEKVRMWDLDSLVRYLTYMQTLPIIKNYFIHY